MNAPPDYANFCQKFYFKVRISRALFFIPLGLVALFLFAASVQGQTVGVVLSGGGGLGMAHIGALRALEEAGIPIDFITGTSAGSIVGAMYAAGLSPEQMENIALRDADTWFEPGLTITEDYFFQKAEPDATFINVPFTLRGGRRKLPSALFSDAAINAKLMALFAHANAICSNDFDNLLVPFRAVAADIYRRKIVILDKGSLAFAVRSSMAVPLFFPPGSNFEHENLFDGGIYDNFPVRPMQDTFSPDIIIGIDVTASPTSEDYQARLKTNFLRQLVSHNIDAESWRKLPPNGIFIAPDLGNMSSTDFSSASGLFAIERGYQATMACIEDIKLAVGRTVPRDTMVQRRRAFMSKTPPLVIGEIETSQVTPGERFFIKGLLKLKPGKAYTLKELQDAYLRLRSAGGYTSTFPELLYRPETGDYKLRLMTPPSSRFGLRFGGVFFTPTDHQLQVRAELQTNQFLGLKTWVDLTRGSFINHVKAGGSVYIPTKIPLLVEAEGVLQSWDMQRNLLTLFNAENRANASFNSARFEPRLSLPIRGVGKMSLGHSIQSNLDQYLIDDSLFRAENFDETRFIGSSTFFTYQVNSINERNYPDKGSELYLSIRYNTGSENFRDRNDNLPRLRREHQWVQARLHLQNYLQFGPTLRMGLSLDACFSTLRPFSNPTATTLSSPKFLPLQDSPILFLPQLYSKAYAAPGMQWIYKLTRNLSFRAEAYWMHRFDRLQEIGPNEFKTDYVLELDRRTIVATGGFVYSTQIGPVGVFLNYYEDKTDALRLFIHIGYMIFSRHPWF